MLLFWSALIVDGRMARLGKWEGGKGGRLMWLERWEGGGMGRWEVSSFIQGWGMQSPKFHLFVFDVNQGNKKTGWNCHWNCMYLFRQL